MEAPGERDEENVPLQLAALERQPNYDLFRYRAFHEIQEKAYRDGVLEKEAGQLEPLSKRIANNQKNALHAYIRGDEENAYYYFLRYLNLLEERLTLVGSHDDNLDAKILKENLEYAREVVNCLSESLSNRYLDRDWEENENLSILERHYSSLEMEIQARKKLHIAQQELQGLQCSRNILKERLDGVKRSRLEMLLALEGDEDIPDDLKCPICFQMFENPVIICKNGHTLCTPCFGGINNNRCPFCQEYCGRGLEVRNRSLESVVESFKQKAVFSDAAFQGKLTELGKLEMAITLKEVGIKILEEELRTATKARMSTELQWWTLEGHLHNPRVAYQTISYFQGGMVGISVSFVTFLLAMEVIISGRVSVFLHPTQVVNGVWYGYQESGPSCRSFLSAFQLLKQVSGVVVKSLAEKKAPIFLQRTASLGNILALFVRHSFRHWT